jgi:hypothetical protein
MVTSAADPTTTPFSESDSNLVRIVQYKLAGAVCASEPSLDRLETSAEDVFKAGPRTLSLSEEARRALAAEPYKPGESESGDDRWTYLGFAAATMLIASCVVFNSSVIDPVRILTGLLACLVIGAGLRVTRFGARFRRLPFWERVIAAIPVAPGAIAVVGGLALFLAVCVAIEFILENWD